MELGGLFHVTSRCARIAVRGRGDAGLITTGAAAGRGPLGPTAANTCGSRIFELFAHAIELGCVLRTEASTTQGRLRTVTSTSTAHMGQRTIFRVVNARRMFRWMQGN
jgi:hypothetical protein